MPNIGELPDIDMKMPSNDLDLPPMLDLDLPAPALDGLPSPAPAKAAPPAKKPEQVKKVANGKAPAKPQQKLAVKAGGKKIKAPSRSSMQLIMGVISIVLLSIIAAVMVLLEVPVNVIPELTLTTYVQSLWLLVGCFFIVTILQDIKTALMLTGLDIALLATIFPTLWLLLDMQMNPLYFFVMGMIVLLALVYLPLSILREKKAPAKETL